MEKTSSFEHFALITIVILVLWGLFSNFVKSWWILSRTNIKCVDYGIPPLGSHWREIFKIEPWTTTLVNMYHKYPNDRFVVLHEIGGRREFLIRDPELLRQITIRDFSSFVNRIVQVDRSTDPIHGNRLSNFKTDDWRRIRNVVTPLLTSLKLKQVVIPSLDENKQDLVQFLSKIIESSGKTELIVDVMDLSTRSGVDGFCLTAFGLKTDSLRSNGNDYGFFDCTQSYLSHKKTMSRALNWSILSFPRVMKHLFGKTLMLAKDQAFFAKSCIDIADNRNSNQIQRSDYIQLLQTLRKSNDNTGKNYNDVELISQCFEFYDFIVTENNALSTFVLQKLAEYPDIQEQLRNEMIEIKKRVGANGLTYEVVNGMKYTEMVVSEALRICQITPEMKRRATRPYELENNNGEKVTIQPGDAVWLPTFALQNDPQYFTDPQKFDPERFSDENKKSHVPGTYAPFGVGPRDCIGCVYPLSEQKIYLYHLLLNFTVESVAPHEGNGNSVKLIPRRK